MINETFTNYIKLKKKKIEVTNPMSDFIIYAHKNYQNKKWKIENKNLTKQILNINNSFLKKNFS